MMSELGRETVSAYAAAKGGLKMLTRNICSEFGEHNIQCNGLGLVILPLLRLHLFVSISQMAAVILLTALFVLRLLPAAGWSQRS